MTSSIIELSTRLRDVAKPDKSRALQAAGLYVLVLIAMPVVLFMPAHGMPWEWPWAEVWRHVAAIPRRIWERGDLEAYGIVLLPPLHYIAMLSMQQRLRITPQTLEWSSRMPAWLAFMQPNWQLQRNQILSVRVDMSRVSGQPRAARVRIETRQGSKAIPLFGWYRLGRPVDAQRIQSKRDFLTGRWQGDLETFPIVQALLEAGIEFTVDGKPVADPLRKSPQGWFIALGSIMAVSYGLYAVINRKFEYAGQLQWLLIAAIGVLAGGVAWQVVRNSQIMREEKIGGAVAAAFMFGFAVWAGAPQLNASTSDGTHDWPYLYAGEGRFLPQKSGPPVLDLSEYRTYLDAWQQGDRIDVPLCRGALEFWQFDRDATISRLANRPPRQNH